MSNTVHAENLSAHFGQTDEGTSHNGEAGVEWLHNSTQTKKLETGSREYQREKVAPVEWKQEILRTILTNTYAKIPQIHIRVTKTIDDYSFELIDGQQRVTSILDFLNGDFKLPDDFKTWDKIDIGGMNASTLKQKQPAVYDRILKYRITTIWYENLDDQQVSNLFVEVLNNTNDMTEQEIRNAVRGLFSTYVRDRVRFEEQHPVFTRIDEGVGPKKKSYLKYLPKLVLKGRMEADEWLSQIIYLNENGPLNGVSNKALTKWVKDIQLPNGVAAMASTKFTPMKRRCDDLLDYAQKIIGAVPKDERGKLTPAVAMMLVLYAWELEKSGEFKIADPKAYTEGFFRTYREWSATEVGKRVYADKFTIDGRQMPPFNELFSGKNKNSVGTIFYVLDLDRLKYPNGFGIKKIDARETFSKADIFRRWKEQDRKCFYTGRVLDEDEIVGDHYIARSRGGLTEYDNLVVTDRQNNLAKLHMNGDEYKNLLKERIV